MPKKELSIYTQLRETVFSETYDKIPKKELTIYIQL